MKVYNNIISNVTHTSTSTMWGIYLNNTGSTTTSVGTSEVYPQLHPDATQHFDFDYLSPDVGYPGRSDQQRGFDHAHL